LKYGQNIEKCCLKTKHCLKLIKKEREEICNYLIGTSVKLPENTTENKYFVKDEEELSVQIEKNLDINTIKNDNFLKKNTQVKLKNNFFIEGQNEENFLKKTGLIVEEINNKNKENHNDIMFIKQIGKEDETQSYGEIFKKNNNKFNKSEKN